MTYLHDILSFLYTSLLAYTFMCPTYFTKQAMAFSICLSYLNPMSTIRLQANKGKDNVRIVCL